MEQVLKKERKKERHGTSIKNSIYQCENGKRFKENFMRMKQKLSISQENRKK